MCFRETSSGCLLQAKACWPPSIGFAPRANLPSPLRSGTLSPLIVESGNAHLFEAMAKLHARYPQWRLGQLVCNAAGWADIDVWDIEDGQLLAAIHAHLKPDSHENT